MQPESIGSVIRESRNSRGQSLRGLALSVGITPPFLADIEKGRRFPSEKNREKLAAALGLKTADLDRFDFRRDLRSLEELLQDSPKLQAAFRLAMAKIRDGKLTVDDLTQAFAERDTSPQ